VEEGLVDLWREKNEVLRVSDRAQSQFGVRRAKIANPVSEHSSSAIACSADWVRRVHIGVPHGHFSNGLLLYQTTAPVCSQTGNLSVPRPAT